MILNKIKFPKKHFFEDEFEKVRIVVHHTEGDPTGLSSIEWWKLRMGGKGKVATPYIINADGQVLQLFDDRFWAYALGLQGKHPNALGLERTSVHIELACYGALIVDNQGNIVDNINKKRIFAPNEVVVYDPPWRGFTYYASYTQAQIDALIELIDAICQKHPRIERKFDEGDFFGKTNKALTGASGIYGHCAFRADKSDPHPQKELIDALSI